MQDDPFARAVERQQAAEQAERAAKRDRRQRQISSGSRTAFRIHATVFLAVNLLLVAIWATTTPGYPWFLWPLLGWGVGLAAHYAATRDIGRRSYRPIPTATAPPTPTPVAPVAAPAPAAPQTSTAEELARLASLHQSGALTDKEFKAAKAKLLQ